MATLGSHIGAVSTLGLAWTTAAVRAERAVAAIDAATASVKRAAAATREKWSADRAAAEAYDRLQEAAKAFGGQYASAAFQREGLAEGAYAGGFLTAAYARDVVKMYAIALNVTRNADGQLPGVLKEAHDSIWRLTQFWQWSGFATRYGSLESLAGRELGALPSSSRRQFGGKAATPGSRPQIATGSSSIAAQQATGALRW